MQTKKMSLANIKGKLSKTEMKNIMAGSGDIACSTYIELCAPGYPCSGAFGSGTCKITGGGYLFCCIPN